MGSLSLENDPEFILVHTTWTKLSNLHKQDPDLRFGPGRTTSCVENAQATRFSRSSGDGVRRSRDCRAILKREGFSRKTPAILKRAWLSRSAGTWRTALKKLYIGNLPFTASEDELKKLFGAHGTVHSVALINDRETGRPRGFGFIEMDDAAAMAAQQALDGKEMDGRALKVNEAQDKPRGGGGGGYGGGRGGSGGGDRW